MTLESLYYDLTKQTPGQIRTFIQKNPNLLNWQDEWKDTLLHVSLRFLTTKLNYYKIFTKLNLTEQDEIKKLVAIASELILQGSNVFRVGSDNKTAYDLMDALSRINFSHLTFDFFESKIETKKNYRTQFIEAYNQYPHQQKDKMPLKEADFNSINSYAKNNFSGTVKMDGCFTFPGIQVANKPIYQPISQLQQYSRQDLMEMNGYFDTSAEITSQRKAYAVHYSKDKSLEKDINAIIKNPQESYIMHHQHSLRFSSTPTRSFKELVKTEQRKLICEAVKKPNLVDNLNQLLQSGTPSCKVIRMGTNFYGSIPGEEGVDTEAYQLIKRVIDTGGQNQTAVNNLLDFAQMPLGQNQPLPSFSA